MVVAEISIVPLGTASPGLSEYIANAVRKLKKSGLRYQLTPMGTIIEGELDSVIEVCRKMHESVFESRDVKRVLTTIKIDDRRDKESNMDAKVKSVEEKLSLEP